MIARRDSPKIGIADNRNGRLQAGGRMFVHGMNELNPIEIDQQG